MLVDGRVLMKRETNSKWILPHSTSEVGTARRLVADATFELDQETVETALLLTSEIVTNALRYGESSIVRLSLSLTSTDLRVEVDDDSTSMPRLAVPGLLEERGRGLMLLDALASEWGVTTRGSAGKGVWFRLGLRTMTARLAS